MRRFSSSVMAMMLVAGLATPVLCGDLKMGYVDTVKIFSEYQKTKDYDKVLQEKQKKKEEERDKKIEELKKLQDQYALLSDKEKDVKKAEIEKKAQELDELRRQTVVDLRKQQNDYMAEIADDIDKVVKKQAKEGSYVLILNGQAVLYGDSAIDMTTGVLNEVNNNYKIPKK